MKKIFVFNCLLLFAINAIAQVTNPGTPRPVELPAPKLKLPADLIISCSNLTTRKNATGATFIKVTVEVKNLGQIASLPATIRGLISTNPANKSTIATPPVHFFDSNKSLGSWKFCTSEPEAVVGVIAPGMVIGPSMSLAPATEIAPGMTISTSFEFKIATAELGSMKGIFFCAEVDYFNKTKESNKNNNMSVPLFFANPAMVVTPGM